LIPVLSPPERLSALGVVPVMNKSTTEDSIATESRGRTSEGMRDSSTHQRLPAGIESRSAPRSPSGAAASLSHCESRSESGRRRAVSGTAIAMVDDRRARVCPASIDPRLRECERALNLQNLFALCQEFPLSGP
jgi:hypothetical protein